MLRKRGNGSSEEKGRGVQRKDGSGDAGKRLETHNCEKKTGRGKNNILKKENQSRPDNPKFRSYGGRYHEGGYKAGGKNKRPLS